MHLFTLYTFQGVVLSVCLFVCLYDLPIKGTQKTLTMGYKHQASNSQTLHHTNIGLTSMIMNGTNQEIVIQHFIIVIVKKSC